MFKPVIEHLGHAGFTVSGNHGQLLIDPWFYPAFMESWFPWPDNRHLMGSAHGNWIYVSHHHEDHFDERFLTEYFKQRSAFGAKFPRIIVPKFRSRRMERKWKALGAKSENMHVLGHGEQLELCTGVTVTMLLDSSHKEDSALLLDHHGYRFLDMNDCELNIREIPQVDELAAQFSGASWYPHCYDYGYSDYVVKAADVRISNVKRMFRRFAASRASVYRPSAGPAAFLPKELCKYRLGETRGYAFPDWPEVERAFLRRFPAAKIGQHLPVTESAWSYAQRRKDECDSFFSRSGRPPESAELKAHFSKLLKANAKLMRAYERSIGVALLDSASSFTIPLALLADELEEVPDPSYILEVPDRVLRAVLDGDCSWETALLSMRCTLHRDPDAYDSTLMSLLSFGDEPAITREIARAQEEVPELIQRDGYELQRWCPHAGEDLTDATISVQGELTCPRHNWSWNLESGECTDGDSQVRIQARKLDRRNDV